MRTRKPSERVRLKNLVAGLNELYEVGYNPLVDARTRLGKDLKTTMNFLIAHLNGRPSATQMVLIERTAFLLLQCRRLERYEYERILKGKSLPEKWYSTLHSQWFPKLFKCLEALGWERPSETGQRLKDYIEAQKLESKPSGKPQERRFQVGP